MAADSRLRRRVARELLRRARGNLRRRRAARGRRRPARAPGRRRLRRGRDEAPLRRRARPDRDEVGVFIRRCRDEGTRFKATAGLHHALPTDGEHGFLNLLAACVFGDEEEMLGTRDIELDSESFRANGRARERRCLLARAPRALRVDRLVLVRGAGRRAAGARDPVKLGVFTVGGGEPHVGRIEGDVVVDLGRGVSVLSEGLSLGHGPRSLSRRFSGSCRFRSRTTSTSTRRSSTRRTWGACSGRIRSR